MDHDLKRLYRYMVEYSPQIVDQMDNCFRIITNMNDNYYCLVYIRYNSKEWEEMVFSHFKRG